MDNLNRFLFDNHAIRGQIARLEETYHIILNNHSYPLPVQKLLGELLVVTSLLTSTLKFDGDIAVQLQGDGPLTLVVVNGNHQQELRGVARMQGEINDDATLKHMLGNGYMVITLTPNEGERYQGIVDLSADTLVGCIENYFMQSEQLPTRLFIKTGVLNGQPMAAGLLLQVLPGEDNAADSLEHLSILTQTVTEEEIFSLPADELLYRLYNQEQVRLFESSPISFKCRCSRQRCEDSLRTLPDSEINEILEQDEVIDMHCDYCGNHYVFDKIDVIQMQSKQKHSYH